MTELLNYINKIAVIKQKLVVNLNTMGVSATVNESLTELVDKVLLINKGADTQSLVNRITEQDAVLVEAQALVNSINCNL